MEAADIRSMFIFKMIPILLGIYWLAGKQS